jgi:hypothetical protein
MMKGTSSNFLQANKLICGKNSKQMVFIGQKILNASRRSIGLLTEANCSLRKIIDLRKHERLWKDFYDTLLAQSRACEPRESLESVKRRLKLV